MPLLSLPFDYKNLLHAHSHLALLGWIFLSITALLGSTYLSGDNIKLKPYKTQFIFFNVSNIGMLLSFPVQGYGPISITFSTLHILVSYWFISSFLKTARTLQISKKYFSFVFITTAFGLFILSTIAPFALGPLMVSALRETPLYHNLIYFYLHFQYNGWLTFAVLGLFFGYLEKNEILFSRKLSMYFFLCLLIACFPSYFLSVLWNKPDDWVYYTAMTGGILQLLALGFLIMILLPIYKHLRLPTFSQFLFWFAMITFMAKIVLQFFSGLPYFAELVYHVRNFIIAYLHLVLIGFISLFILSWHIQMGNIGLARPLSRLGLGSFVLGFLLSEILLVRNAVNTWQKLIELESYYHVLFFVSILMPLGILLLLPEQFSRSRAT